MLLLLLSRTEDADHTDSIPGVLRGEGESVLVLGAGQSTLGLAWRPRTSAVPWLEVLVILFRCYHDR